MMSNVRAGTILHYLGQLAAPCAGRSLTDRQLLERFGAGDQAAFASLVKRHGRLVWDVCRRALGDDHDAEDAFQAAFVVLALKPGSVRRADSLGSWLYGVALRTAMNAKRKAARRRALERRHAPTPAPPADAGMAWREVQTLLDEEVQRLPPGWRAAFVSCCMQGKSLADAARELGKSEAAMAVSLSRARKRLQQRLQERGVALGPVLAAGALTASGASAAIPAGVLASTIRAAAHVAAHQGLTAGAVSASVAALAKAVAKEMTRMSITRLSVVVALVVAGALAGGAAWLSRPARAGRPAGQPPATAGTTGASGALGRNVSERIAWGEAVDGLQAGLGVAHEGDTCRIGASAELVIWVRNVGAKRAKLAYRAGWFYESRPAVVSGDGKQAKVGMPPKADFRRPALELALEPGQSLELNPVALALAPADETTPTERPTARVSPGSYRISYAGLSMSHPKLATGQLEVTVGRADAAKKEKEGPSSAAAKRLVGSWRGKDGGAGPTYHADGTGKNYDGSKFEWRLEGDFLVARKAPGEGKPGGWSHVPILFSRDGKEYRLLLDTEPCFYRMLANGKGDERRSEEGRSFPRKQVPDEGEEDVPTPTLTPAGPAPGRGAAKPAPAEGAAHVGPNVHVSGANAKVLHAEVVLAADPVDRRRLVAASMYSPPPVGPAATKVIVYASADGGKSWAPTLERKDANPATIADPAFAWGAGDSLFFVNMWAPSLDALWDAGCLQVVRSRDGGRTWGPTTTISAYHDRPFLAADVTGGKYAGRLYCLTHEGLLISSDSGRSFSAPRTWPRRPGFGPYGSGNPVVLSDGTLVVLYNNSSKRETAEQQKREPAQDRRYLAVRTSRDGGDSFTEERMVADYQGDGFPMMAAAPAGAPWKDHVYVVWQEALPGGRRCVSYAYSKDRGATFSKPAVLSEQSGAEGDHDAFLGSIAVNKAGVVAATWYDTRGLRPGEAGRHVRIRTSLDGGETWRASVQVSDAPTLKGKKKRLPGVGHTAGLAAGADGVFHCLWVDGRSGVPQVYTAAVRVTARKEP